MSRRVFTSEQIDFLIRTIEEAVSAGKTISQAARDAGISDLLYYKWRRRLGLPATHSKTS